MLVCVNAAEVEGITMVHVAFTERLSAEEHFARMQPYSPIAIYSYCVLQYGNARMALDAIRRLKSDFEADLHHDSWFVLSGALRARLELLIVENNQRLARKSERDFRRDVASRA